jgi:hypothetical protein
MPPKKNAARTPRDSPRKLKRKIESESSKRTEIIISYIEDEFVETKLEVTEQVINILKLKNEKFQTCFWRYRELNFHG